MGDTVGTLLGDALGIGVGAFLVKVGDKVGVADGDDVGERVGTGVGEVPVV